MKNFYSYLLLATLFYSTLLAQEECVTLPVTAEFNPNNVGAQLGQSGFIWWGYYNVPNTPIGVSSLYAGSLWIGGIDPGGNLKLAANFDGFEGGETDYFQGPIDPETGFATPESCEHFNRFWNITRAEIDDFIADFEDNQTIDELHPGVFAWPGRENPLSEEYNGFVLPVTPQGLAPFWDVNGDGVYNPMAGDYPDVPGDDNMWWVFNDAGGIHFNTNAEPLNIEIQALAYGFAPPDDELINNTTFYDFKLINRGFEVVDSVSISLWLDVDLGCPVDDRIGCIPEESIAYVYNEDDTDGENECICGFGVNTYCNVPPIFAFKQLAGPLDDNGQELGMTSFMTYFDQSNNIPPNMTKPELAPEIYNYMNGRWRDNEQPTDPEGNPTSFLYPGNPADTTEWSMCTDGFSQDDRRMMMNTGPFRLDPGEINRVAYAAFWRRDVPHPCPDITPILEACEKIDDFFEDVVSSTTEHAAPSNLAVNIYPNPMVNTARLSLTDHSQEILAFHLYDSYGRQLSPRAELFLNEISLEKGMLDNGIYFYEIVVKSGNILTGKLIIK